MFQFDLKEVMISGVFISGGTGSGKSNLAFLLADQLMKNGVTVYAFDPSQVWKRESSIPNCVSISEVIKEKSFIILPKASTIYDISLLQPSKQRNFVEHFCRVLFNERAKSTERPPTFLVFEESQLYIRQGELQTEVAEEILRIITVGRNYNIRFALLAQFPSMIDRAAIKYCKLKFYGYCDFDDVEYLRSFIGTQADALNTLKVGEFVYCFGNSFKRIKAPLFVKV